MKQFFTVVAVFICLMARGQAPNFQSAQTYTPEQMDAFYASITVQQNLLLFNAPDYYLYAYDKHTGALKWRTRLGWKSNTPPFFVQEYILANNHKEKVVQLDTATGKLVKELPFYNLASQPLLKNGILYTTAIYDAGNLLAYDPRLDSVLWYRFLAHGFERAPYYQPDRIWANGEGSTWFEFDFTGRIVTPTCDPADPEQPWTPACQHTFVALSHDGKKIPEKLSKKWNLYGAEHTQVLHAPGTTLLLADGILYTLGNGLKLKAVKPLQAFFTEEQDEETNSPQALLKVKGDTVWLLHNNRVLVYDFKKKKLQQTIDLSAWTPHQVLPEEENLWFVSRKDGRLYRVPSK